MASILKSLRLAADPNRLRLLLVLDREELSVAELQEILGLGQSHISTHLAQLKQAGLVDDRRTGKNAFYRLQAPAELMTVLRGAAAAVREFSKAVIAERNVKYGQVSFVPVEMENEAHAHAHDGAPHAHPHAHLHAHPKD